MPGSMFKVGSLDLVFGKILENLMFTITSKTDWAKFVFTIRYQGSWSSTKCHVCHLVKGRKHTQLWFATKGGISIPTTIPLDMYQPKATKKLLKPVTIPVDQ